METKQSIYMREWRKNNKERNAKINRKAQKNWYDKMIKNPPPAMLLYWRKKYHSLLKRIPEKVKAREFLRYSVRVGDIKRGKCEVCGVIKTHGHHNDYSKPLKVNWLCAKHHKELHSAQKRKPVK